MSIILDVEGQPLELPEDARPLARAWVLGLQRDLTGGELALLEPGDAVVTGDRQRLICTGGAFVGPDGAVLPRQGVAVMGVRPAPAVALLRGRRALVAGVEWLRTPQGAWRAVDGSQVSDEVLARLACCHAMGSGCL